MVVIASLSATAQAATDAVPGELIVRFTDGTSRSESRAIVNGSDASIETRLPGDSAVIAADPGQTTAEVAAALERQDGVAYVEPNYVVRRESWSSDTFLTDGTLWGLIKTKAPLAWGLTRGQGAVVAVLDSGISLDHPELTGGIWQNPDEQVDGRDDDGNGIADDVYGADFVHGDGTPDDEQGHGTHVAGTIAAAADDGNPAVGMAPDAQIMPLKFLDGSGAGNVGDAISAIDYAIDKGADVINASWGGPDYSSALKDAIDRAGQAGVVFAAAAGNDGTSNDSEPNYPASMELPSLISVAAIERSGELASFSNYGADSVDIAAPGTGIYSTVPGGYESWSGTSMATPHVSGVAALLKSASPNASAAEIVAALKYGVRPLETLESKVESGGMLDTVQAFKALGVDLMLNGAAPRAFRLKRPGKKVRVRGNGKVKFSWSSAVDEDLVGYEIYVDGKLKAIVEDPDGSAGPRGARTSAKIKVGAGKHRWSVIAVDEAGNQRKASSGKSKGRVAVSRSRG